MKHRRALLNEAPKMDCRVSRTAFPLARLRLLMILQKGDYGVEPCIRADREWSFEATRS